MNTSNFQTHASKCLDAAFDVTDGWKSLADNMNEMMLHIKSITPKHAEIVVKIQLKIQLNAADLEWENIVLKQAGHYF